MQRLYIWIIIAAVVFAASYSKTIRNFLMPEEAPVETAQPEPAGKDDSYEQLGAELYTMAASFQNLQGKVELLKMAKEKREWFKQEDYARLDVLLEAAQKDLAKAEVEFQKARENYTRITVQKMLEASTPVQQQ